LSQYNVLLLREQEVQQILLHLLAVVNEFASKWNSGSFDFCSCTGFAARIGKANEFAAFSNQKCGLLPPAFPPAPSPKKPLTPKTGSRKELKMAHKVELEAFELEKQTAALEESLEE
jgi:hypothetical protein